MTERPILFNASMVRAILSGQKTQTRRILKPQPQMVQGKRIAPWEGDGVTLMRLLEQTGKRCPYGQPGDRLWVRETWRIGSWWDDDRSFWLDYCDGPRKERLECPDADMAERLIRQTGEDLRKRNVQPTNGTMYEWAPGESPLRWRPGIHMPRWASRITLEITGVRLERLRSISEADAVAEGVAKHDDGKFSNYLSKSGFTFNAVSSFRSLWESINGPDSWTQNPWVWALDFKRA